MLIPPPPSPSERLETDLEARGKIEKSNSVTPSETGNEAYATLALAPALALHI